MQKQNNIKSFGIFKDHEDGSIKCVFSVDNGIIEMTLLINRPGVDVVCVPSHHFCNLGCKFCHLTNNRLNKKSIPICYEDFISALRLTLLNQKTLNRRTENKKLLLSFMGVGEPTMNFNLIKELNSNVNFIKGEFGYEYVCFSLATMMPDVKLKEITEIVNSNNIPLKIHFSLHNPIDFGRKEIIPASSNSIDNCFDMLKNYERTILNNDAIIKKHSFIHRTKDVIEVHYTLIENVNDTNECLEKLCHILQKYPVTIKFIRFNAKDDMKVSTKENVWVERLKKDCDIKVKVYSPPGKNIGSSCGQFTKHYYHEEIEDKESYDLFQKWKKEYEIFD